MTSGLGHDFLRDSGLLLCAVCQTWVGVNSFEHCGLWVPMKCCVVRGKLVADSDYVCSRCHDQTSLNEVRRVTQAEVDSTQLGVDASFSFLCDLPCSGGGYVLTNYLQMLYWLWEIQETSAFSYLQSCVSHDSRESIHRWMQCSQTVFAQRYYTVV